MGTVSFTIYMRTTVMPFCMVVENECYLYLKSSIPIESLFDTFALQMKGLKEMERESENYKFNFRRFVVSLTSIVGEVLLSEKFRLELNDHVVAQVARALHPEDMLKITKSLAVLKKVANVFFKNDKILQYNAQVINPLLCRVFDARAPLSKW